MTPDLPHTRYTESDGLSIAYQVFGAGAKDVVVVPGILTHVELNWEYPAYAQMPQADGGDRPASERHNGEASASCGMTSLGDVLDVSTPMCDGRLSRLGRVLAALSCVPKSAASSPFD